MIELEKRKPRDFQNKRAKRVLKEVRDLFKKEKRPLHVHDLARMLHRTPRQMREYLNYMHLVTRELFIQSYVESTGVRGKKLPCYRVKRKGNESDAVKWWLADDIDSEGGHCD